MNIQVTPHTIAITINTNINAGEYNITPCEFTFTEEYEDLTKEAIFSSCDGSVFKVSILNNQCTIPYEVLQQEGNVLLGVYAYETNDDELVLRYSPTPQYFNVKRGSFQVGNDPDLPSPTEWERVLEQINQAIEETNNLNITANKEGKVTTVTITKKDGTTQEVEINDGKDLEFKWQGTSLGVRQEGQSEYDYTDLKGAKGDTGATPNIQIGDVQTGDTSEVTITGTDENPILNFTLEKGDTGNGISSITKTATSGLVDTYTITFTNGQTTTYQITNGENGSVVDVQVDGTSVVDNGIANIIGLTEMKQELEDMYNLLPKVQGTGETITLDGTVAGKMLVDLKGNTSQETTTGKNMYEGSQDFSGAWNNNSFWGTDGTYNGLVVKKRNGQWEGINKEIEVVSGETYTFSLYVKSNADRTVSIYLAGGTATINPSGKSFTSTTSWERVSITFTASSNGTVRPRLENIDVIANNYTYICGYQLEKSSIMTDYEPYTGNQPSPSPSYPQDIHVVSGDNSIDVISKNILHLPNSSRTNGGITGTITNDNILTYSGTASRGYADITVAAARTLQAGTYTFSIDQSQNVRVVLYENNRAHILAVGETQITFDISQDTPGYYYVGISGMTSGTAYSGTIKMQLEKSSSKTKYEPYQSQSYPINLGDIELCKIGDYQDRIFKSSGKNLFNKNNINGLNAYLDTTNNKLVSNNNNKSIYISCKPNTTYTISKTPSKRFGVAYTYTTPENNTAIYGTITNYDGASITITTDTNAQYLVVWLINSNISGEISYQTAIDTLQIECGNTLTDFEPYGKAWYLNKQIGKVVLNGSESWSNVGSVNNGFYCDSIITALNPPSGITTVYTYSDNFVSTYRSAISNYDYSIGQVNNGSNTGHGNIIIRNKDITGYENFKTWLSTHNTEVYYVLAIPTYTEITDSTLISQLETIKRSFNGQTNISQTNNDKPFILDVTALKELTQ